MQYKTLLLCLTDIYIDTLARHGPHLINVQETTPCLCGYREEIYILHILLFYYFILLVYFINLWTKLETSIEKNALSYKWWAIYFINQFNVYEVLTVKFSI
jgi:hypothetical protein